MKILVTGGAGYIGSHTVVELAKAGYSPIIVDDLRCSQEIMLSGLKSILGKKIDHYAIDAASQDLEKVFIDHPDLGGAIHFAAYKAVGESVQQPIKYYENNILATSNLLKLMLKYEVAHYVFSSSCTVYGQPDILPVTETTERKPAQSPYGRTKQICEDLVFDLMQGGAKLAPVLLRYFNPIGAHESAAIGELAIGVPNNLVPFVTQTAAGLREKLTVFGDDYNTPDGSCIRDYIHVTDLARAHVAALEYLQKGGKIQVFNAGTGQGSSVLEILRTFERVNNIKLNYEIGPRRSGDIEKIWANCDLIEKELGWKAQLGLEEALKSAWQWQQTLNAQS